MADIVFDYSEIKSAKSKAEDIAGGWFSSGIDDYKSGLKSSLKSPLDEWRLSESEPYGHAYVSSAQGNIDTKISALDTAATKWTNLATKLGDFVQYVQDRDSDVVNIFETTSDQYTDYKGLKGVFNYISDVAYNFFAVDLANSNGFTRAVADWGKEKADDFSSVLQDAEEYFKHGNGRYVLNMVGSVLGTVAAIAGTVVAIVSIPFTGGSTAVIAVGCIGATASAIAAMISAVNTCFAVKENCEALKLEEDPGAARFHGDVEKFSDYVEKTDFGSKEANEFMEKSAKNVDTVKAVADTVSTVCSVATTFGTKTTVVGVDDVGKDITKTSFDFSAGNVKKNVLKTFGFDVDSKKVTTDTMQINETKVVSSADDIGNATIDITNASYDVQKTTMVSSADEIGDVTVDITKTSYDAQKTTMFSSVEDIDDINKVGDTTLDITKATYDANYKSTIFEKTVDVAEDGAKNVTKTVTFNKAKVSTEYSSVVASNNVVTQGVSTYTRHAEAASTVIDYTEAAKITPFATFETVREAVQTPSLKTVAKAVDEVSSFGENVTSFMKDSDEVRIKKAIQNVIKTNHLASQIDKYLLKVDISEEENKYYIGGDTTKKITKIWETITEPKEQ